MEVRQIDRQTDRHRHARQLNVNEAIFPSKKYTSKAYYIRCDNIKVHVYVNVNMKWQRMGMEMIMMMMTGILH